MALQVCHAEIVYRPDDEVKSSRVSKRWQNAQGARTKVLQAQVLLKADIDGPN